MAALLDMDPRQDSTLRQKVQPIEAFLADASTIIPVCTRAHSGKVLQLW